MLISYVLPLFINEFQGWNLLQNPTHVLELFFLWKKLLQGELSDPGSPYTRLVMEVIYPAVREFGIDTWEATDPEPMLCFLESWNGLQPVLVCQIILENIVMPKLLAAIDSWDPRETDPIHLWVHPWLQQKLESLYDTILIKLESVLEDWQSDMALYSLLSPWKTIFDSASWEKLMVRCNMPKLLTVIHDLQMSQANKNPVQFSWVQKWASSLPIHHMLPLMDVFFDRWQEFLYHWVCSYPNFNEVSEWYLNWKGHMTPDLLANEHIRKQLNVGLNVMEQAVESLEVVKPGSREDVSYPKKAQFEAQEKSSANLFSGSQMEGIGGQHEMSLKDVVGVYAQQNGLLFKPKPGRVQDGYQIYRFGKVSVIINSHNKNLFALNEDRWTLVSLELLLKLHNHSGLKCH